MMGPGLKSCGRAKQEIDFGDIACKSRGGLGTERRHNVFKQGFRIIGITILPTLSFKLVFHRKNLIFSVFFTHSCHTDNTYQLVSLMSK